MVIQYVIVIYGLLIIAISLVMVAKPDLWVAMTVRYCRLPYMHPVEILVCLGFGLSFVFYAGQSEFPAMFKFFGYVLVAVGLGLILTPPSYHRRFGIWSVEKIGRYFRPAGLFSLIFGAFLVYAAL